MTTPKHLRRTVLLAGSIALLLPGRAAEIQKANNANTLFTGASWVGGVLPTASDVGIWDNTITAANTSQFGGNLTLQGIKVLNPTGNTIMADNVAGSPSVNTLTLGSAGIDMSAATVGFQAQSRVLLSANQNWNVANSVTGINAFGFNFSEDLSFAAQANGIPFDLGGFTVTKTGIGTTIISSGYTVDNGTFNVNTGVLAITGAGNRATNVGAGVTFNVASGSTLRFQGASGATNVGGTINLNGGTILMTSSNATNGANINGPVNVLAASMISLTDPMASAVGGPIVINGNISGSAPLNVSNTTNTVTFLRLGGDNSAYSGTITFTGTAGRVSRLTSSTAGSTNARWVVDTGHTLEVDGTTVQLGNLSGGGTITNSNGAGPATLDVGAGDFAGFIVDGLAPVALIKSGTGTLQLSGTNSYTGTTSVNAGTLLAVPGSLGTTNVTVSSGANLGVKLTTAGSTLVIPNVTSSGALSFDLGTLGNPTAVTMNVGNLTIQAPTTLRLSGTNLAVGTFPLLRYTTIGGLGVPGVSLALPPRVLGSLSNAASQFSVTITGFDAPKWTGAVNGKWDIDNGTGTANWREINSGTATRYIQGANGADSVRFDDSATGVTDVELTTTLLPAGIIVNNATRTYTFTGAGKISGSKGLTKTGTGTLRVRNAGQNDYAGETIISGGILELGDGVTMGVGTLGTGAITNDATFALNRPDAFTIPQAVTGSGGITKSGGGLATFSGAVNQGGTIALNAGGLAFSGGGNLSGAITGAGLLAVTAGAMEFSGATANTYTGETAVNGGNLRLNKAPGVTAVGGNLTITGGATVAILTNEQIANTATITFSGTSGDSLAGSTGTETVANVVVKPSVATGQLIMRNGFTVTGLATVESGIFGIASGHTATVNAINISGGSVRLGGNAAPSTLNVGPGGITASGGIMEVKFSLADFDAVVELGGDFTATGNFAITNANYTGPNLSRINLNGSRTFNIAAGTTTTVQPDIAGSGALIKTGAGTLDLLGRPAAYTGNTTITAGTLRTLTTQSGTPAISIADAGDLVLRIPLAGTTLATQTLTLGSSAGSRITFDLNGLGNPTAVPLQATTFTSTGANTLELLGAVTPGTFPLIDYTGTLNGGFASLTLKLPLRVAGSLVNNAAQTRVDVTILGTDTPRWNGNVSNVWDIDNGTGTGTANWRGLFTGNPLRYLQGGGGTDSVLFDDSATGPTNINLGATLTPVNATVSNTTKTYTFSGTNKLSGSSVLIKEGSGTLILANTTAYDHTGGTFVNAGTLQVGDGTTPAMGILPTTTITNNGTVRLERPDNFDISATFAAASLGTLVKNRANTATFVAPATYPGPISLNAGTLRFIGGGNLSGAISGAGLLAVDGGTLQLSGGEANTFTGLTTVASGTLQLNKSGVDAIAGNIELQGGGAITFTQGNQIADTAKLIYNKSVGNQVIANETLGSIDIINGGETSQLQAQTGFVVTGLLTINTTAANVGLFGVASGHSASVGGLSMNNGIVRIAGNSGFSTLTVGPSGIAASGGVIQVGQGTGAFDALLELRGNVTTTGNLNVTDGNFAGAQKREIDLGDTTRIFSIGDGTTTTIAPDLVGTGGLTKSGTGTLTLTSASNSSYTGDTTIQAGTMVVNGSLSASANIAVRSGATLDVSGVGNYAVNAGQNLRGSGTVNGPVNFLAGAKLTPGDTAGNLTFTNNVDLSLAVAAPVSGALLFELGAPASSDSVTLTAGALSIGSGVLDLNDIGLIGLPGLTAATYTLFDTSTPIIGTLGTFIESAINGVPFRLQFANNGNDLVLVPVPEPTSTGLIVAALGMLGALRRPPRRASRS